MNSEEIFRTHIKENAKLLIQHTERVVQFCQEFADYLEAKGIIINKPLLIHAAWLHDIAKFDSGAEHNEQENVKKILDKYDMELSEFSIESITYIISMHKDEFNPEKYIRESAILRVCDKLDKFNKKPKRADRACEKAIDKISKLDENEEWFTAFEEIYNIKKTQLKRKIS